MNRRRLAEYTPNRRTRVADRSHRPRQGRIACGDRESRSPPPWLHPASVASSRTMRPPVRRACPSRDSGETSMCQCASRSGGQPAAARAISVRAVGQELEHVHVVGPQHSRRNAADVAEQARGWRGEHRAPRQVDQGRVMTQARVRPPLGERPARPLRQAPVLGASEFEPTDSSRDSRRWVRVSPAPLCNDRATTLPRPRPRILRYFVREPA